MKRLFQILLIGGMVAVAATAMAEEKWDLHSDLIQTQLLPDGLMISDCEVMVRWGQIEVYEKTGPGMTHLRIFKVEPVLMNRWDLAADLIVEDNISLTGCNVRVRRIEPGTIEVLDKTGSLRVYKII